MLRGRWVAVVLLALVVGCDDGPGSQQEIPAGLGFRIAAAECGLRARCCAPEELEGSFTDDDASCRISLGTRHEGLTVPAVQASAAAGRLTLDVGALERCLEDVAGRSCSAYAATSRRDRWDVFRGCDGAVSSHQGLGDTCRLSLDCTTRYCKLGEGSADGACALLPGRDAGCPDGACAEGFYCEGALERCVPELPDGATCTSSRECDSGACLGTCVGWCTGGGLDQVTEPGPLELLGAAMVEAECAGASRCCDVDDLAERVLDGPAGDEITCRSRRATEVESFLVARYKAIRADRGTIVQSKLDECRAFLESGAECGDFATWSPSYFAPTCDGWFTGTISCFSNTDCGRDGYCASYYDAATGTVLGECWDGGNGGSAVGESCVDDFNCAVGACVGNDSRRGIAGACALVCGGAS